MALEDQLRGLIENRNTGNSARWNKMIAAWTSRNAPAILAALTERKAPVEVEGLVERLRDAARRRGEAGNFSPVAFIEWEAATALLSQATELATLKQQLAEREEALRRAIETLAASRHLIGRYVSDHHWLPEHDARIAELKAALTDKGTEQKDGEG